MKNIQAVAFRRLLIVLTAGLAVAVMTLLALAGMQTDLSGSPGSGSFGQVVVVLANGNIVVTDPYYDALGPITDTGAVYLYNGATGALISQLTGSAAYDQVGSGGIRPLRNDNYVVLSPNWDNGAATNAGAVTWGNGTTGIMGIVSITNSLVGSTANDQVGSGDVSALSNGNYIVLSPRWDYGMATDAGAVTWANGSTGITGVVSITNSLVGSAANDQIGSGSIRLLSNGNYVVRSPSWDNGAATNAGAVTWGSGATGITGIVSITNSLVGSMSNDRVGTDYIIALSNGNYVVRSPFWDNGAAPDAGAVTWGNGSAGITGVVSITNSLVGSMANDQVSISNVRELSNGNYVVLSPYWDNGAAADVGAVTWANGTTEITGVVSLTNSLVGSTTNDQVGSGDIRSLSNGNYVVRSPYWDNGATTDAGAVTWANGAAGIAGAVSITNSLVGSTANDLVGISGVAALSNGNYAVGSAYWDNGSLTNAGAVTWANGMTGITGVVSITNSLVGSTASDRVGSGSLWELSNGNYVVLSPNWDNGATTDAGAATWGNGLMGITGIVTITNSLVGSTPNDRVGSYGVAALSNGNYVVQSLYWNNGAATAAGAVTWGNGITGITGTVSAVNSLVGSATSDQVGSGSLRALSNGNYVAQSPYWDNGAALDVGAVTWGNGATGITGIVSITNSLVGSTASDQVGSSGIWPLSNGNYVVVSSNWDNGAAADAGAVTWANGTTGTIGVVSITNSLVGSTPNDLIGANKGVRELSNGNYVVRSPNWDNGALVDAGAVTWGDSHGKTVGPITADNSVRGLAAGGGQNIYSDYDSTNNQLIVGRPADNIVTLFRPINLINRVHLPLVRKE